MAANSAEYTIRLGAAFSKCVDFGDLIILSGDLGGGKTTFVSGVAQGLGIKESITSPSFTLINEYAVDSKRFVHADLYRLEGFEEVSGTGIQDYIDDDHSLVCIEWGDKLWPHLGKAYVHIFFYYVWDSPDRRTIVLKSNHAYWDQKLRNFGKIIH